MPHENDGGRLPTHFRRPRTRPGNQPRPLPPRDTIVVRRLDTTAPSARPREIEITLWRIKSGEGVA